MATNGHRCHLAVRKSCAFLSRFSSNIRAMRKYCNPQRINFDPMLSQWKDVAQLQFGSSLEMQD